MNQWSLLTAPKLLVVMPVYNEEVSVRKVVFEWFAEIESWTEDFIFLAIDDGSKDNTRGVLQGLAEKFGPRMVVHSRANRGHGQSCLEGYAIAAEMGAEYVFQIDSDGQCDPQYFRKVWQLRHRHDVVYGVRVWRDDGVMRLVVSKILRLFILVLFRASCRDANVPYRLMRTAGIVPTLGRIPPDVFLANAALSVLLALEPNLRHGYTAIGFRERYGGEPSVRAAVFARKAKEFYHQMMPVVKQGRASLAAASDTSTS